MTVVEANGGSFPDGRAAGEVKSPSASSPQDALRSSRVDLVGIIEKGIRPRAFVPGADPVPKGKRIHVAAKAKSGKSLAFGVVMALDTIGAGGTVVVLDRENGADEYARRLATVFDARGSDDAFRAIAREHLQYHEWPSLSLGWREDPTYPIEFAGADVVIFDSSRSHTSQLGLAEDASDDWARFTAALIDPLARAGIATITLDNMGHAERGRPRGTSAKEDLCDLAYTMKASEPFGPSLTGLVELCCSASRIGEIAVGDTWRMGLGGGVYGSWQRSDSSRGSNHATDRPTAIMERVSTMVEATADLTANAIHSAVTGSKGHVSLALQLLISEGYLDVKVVGQAHLHHSVRPYREADDAATGSQPGPNRVPDSVQATESTGSHPPRGGPGLDPVGGDGGSGNRVPFADEVIDSRTNAELQALIDDDTMPEEEGI